MNAERAFALLDRSQQGVFVPMWAMEEARGNARDAIVLSQLVWFLAPSQRERLPEDFYVERRFLARLYITDDEMSTVTGLAPDDVRRAYRSLDAGGLVARETTFVNKRKVTLYSVRPDLVETPR